MREPSINVYNQIEGYEARKKTVYRDIRGIATGGVGHTGRDLPPVGTVLSDVQIDTWFKQDVDEACRTIARHIPADVIAAIPEISYDALVSFTFNVGEQAFVDPKTGKQTNFAKTLCERKWDEVDDRMRDWVFAGGRKVNGLIARRAAESSQWSLGFDGNLSKSVATQLAASAAAPANAAPAEESGAVPDAPAKAPLITPRGIMGLVATAIGTVSGAAPDMIASGNQMRTMVGDIKALNILGAVIVAVGIGFVLWGHLHQRAKTGA